MAERNVLFMVTSGVTVSTFLAPIVRALTGRGAVVDIASSSLPDGTDLAGARHHELPMARSLNPLSLLRAIATAFSLVRRSKPDILVCATPVASLVGVVLGRALRVPHVVHLCWGLRSESMSGVARHVVSGAERLTVRLAHITLANSPSLRDAVVAADPSVAGRVECLGAGTSHGVDLTRFAPAPFGTHARPVIGFVGRVRRDKGVLELLDAADALTAEGVAFDLLVVGEFEEDDLAARIAVQPSVQHRDHTDDVPALMRELDVLVLPTWREGFPNVVLEASATARPVITTDATGAVDSVQDEVTGLVVPVRDSAALAAAMRRLIDDPAERARMGKAGRAWTEAEFDETLVCDRLAARVLDGSRTGVS